MKDIAILLMVVLALYLKGKAQHLERVIMFQNSIIEALEEDNYALRKKSV